MIRFLSAGVFYYTKAHCERVARLQAALDKAATDIVERWYSDEKRAFPDRMPLRATEDKLLRWVCGPGSAVVPPFRDRQGNWRPDYLTEKVTLPDGSVTEGIKVCEINARFPWNAFVILPHTAQVMQEINFVKSGMRHTLQPNTCNEVIKNYFDLTKPLHIVNEKFPMRDPMMLAELFRKTTGQVTRVIKPSDLRWLPDESSGGAHGVFCVTPDGTLERVYQVDFELEQEEFDGIDFKMLCQLARNCVNDLRSTFFINDQRFLGVVYEELEDLVSRGTLTQAEADIVREGLAPSFLPTSTNWSKVIEECKADPAVKDQWVLKFARSGLSQGHVFGKVTDSKVWQEKLMAAQVSNCDPEGDSYVLQKYIEQMDYNVWSHLSNETERYHLVSSWFASNGRFMGIGGVRTADLVILKFSTGDGFAMIPATDA
ncbi:hypothetical protein GE09DRAFT_946910 [Coniochaeta sp. 2T2.1]|nr:hypothetical protein GE09DRAFT_946910 [Coniochaeta sp. 2T2.1]